MCTYFGKASHVFSLLFTTSGSFCSSITPRHNKTKLKTTFFWFWNYFDDNFLQKTLNWNDPLSDLSTAKQTSTVFERQQQQPNSIIFPSQNYSTYSLAYWFFFDKEKKKKTYQKRKKKNQRFSSPRKISAVRIGGGDIPLLAHPQKHTLLRRFSFCAFNRDPNGDAVFKQLKQIFFSNFSHTWTSTGPAHISNNNLSAHLFLFLSTLSVHLRPPPPSTVWLVLHNLWLPPPWKWLPSRVQCASLTTLLYRNKKQNSPKPFSAFSAKKKSKPKKQIQHPHLRHLVFQSSPFSFSSWHNTRNGFCRSENRTGTQNWEEGRVRTRGGCSVRFTFPNLPIASPTLLPPERGWNEK